MLKIKYYDSSSVDYPYFAKSVYFRIESRIISFALSVWGHNYVEYKERSNSMLSCHILLEDAEVQRMLIHNITKFIKHLDLKG